MEILFDKRNWEIFVKEPSESSVTFENGAVTIEKNVSSAAILRTIPEIKAECGKCYKISVELETKGCRNSAAPYVMLTQFDANKNKIIRMYLMNEDEDGTIKSLLFKAEEFCDYLRIDVGLRGTGKVKFNKVIIEETLPIPERKVKIAATRLNSSKTEKEAMDKIKAVAEKAGKCGADLIIFGEVINDFGTGLPVCDTAQTLDGEYVSTMKEYAKKYNTYIVINFHEKDEKDRIYNTSVLIDRQGSVTGKYRKTHISFNEYESGVTPGEELNVFDTDFGKLGILICWDAYFPEPARVLAEKGAEIIAISTAGNPAYRHIARAMENGVYIAVSGDGCCPKSYDERLFASKVISPCGEILAAADEDGDIAFCEVDLSSLNKIHWLSVAASDAVPNNIYMNEKRPELYGNITN